MKKLFTITALAILIISPAKSVTKCVALGASTSCSGEYTQQTLNWKANCWANGISDFPISGVAGCSSQSGFMGTTYPTITGSGETDANHHCWCKMVSPAVSEWTYSTDLGTSDACAESCAADCAGSLSMPAFKNAMFSSLSD